MICTTLFPGRYVQGAHSISRLPAELSRFGKQALLICTPHIFKDPSFFTSSSATEKIDLKTECFNGDCSDEEINRLCGLAQTYKSEVIAGIGGGKTLDTAKAVAHQLKLPVAIVPSIASSDAPCSALSVIYTASGAFERYLILPQNPDLVLVDTQIIAQAPSRFLVAGMGDALATWFEAESCSIKYAGNMSGDHSSRTALTLAKLCYDTLIDYGPFAKQACKANIVTPALENIVEANILLSGLGFESGGLATSHAIHNGFTTLEQTHAYFHGEKVAFGTLASLFLTNKPMATINKVFSFCEAVGLPTTLKAIGLSHVSDTDLMNVAKRACAEGETIHNESVPVTPELVFSALKAADVYGQRKNAAEEE